MLFKSNIFKINKQFKLKFYLVLKTVLSKLSIRTTTIIFYGGIIDPRDAVTNDVVTI